jgi:hypothetical protein
MAPLHFEKYEPAFGAARAAAGALMTTEYIARPFTDTWIDAVRTLVPTPEAYRAPALPDEAALKLLGCDDTVLELLVAHGLPALQTVEGRRFDYHDLANVAIYSQSGCSVPEVGQRMLMRYASATPEEWLKQRTLTLTWELRCGAPHCGGGTWRARIPQPELFGGQRGPAEPGNGAQIVDELFVVADGVSTLTVALPVLLRGRPATVRSPIIRSIYGRLLNDLTEGRVRYQWLPGALRTDPAAALANGTLDCVAAALLLASRLEAAGVSARTRQGSVLGLVSVDHAWTEALDDDGSWKVLDPIFALLGQRTADAHPEFGGFCEGSVPSRFLPWDVAAGQPVAEHVCASGDAAPVGIFTVEQRRVER